MKPMSLQLVFALTVFGSFPANSIDVWRTPDGTAIPDTPARKAINGFGASLVITADADWQAKWETPSDVTPNFTEAKSVSTGGSFDHTYIRRQSRTKLA
jgi:hypothetical protein